MEKLRTGSAVLDELLDGGYEKDVLTTIYGPAGTGKTCICLLAAVEASRDKKIIYIDTEGGFSAARLSQLSGDPATVMQKIFFLKPTSFDEQKTVFEQLRNMVNDKIGLVVVDTISMLYRLMLCKDSVYEVNRDLGKQLSYLVEIARKHSIPVLVTNQVYADFENRNKVHIVGGDILKYSSKCLIELQALNNGTKKAILRKHRSLPYREAAYVVEEKGIIKPKKKGSFGLF